MKKQQKDLPNSVSQGLNATLPTSITFTMVYLHSPGRGKTCLQGQEPRDLDKGSVRVLRQSPSLCAIPYKWT